MDEFAHLMHLSPNDLFQFDNGATREEGVERGSANPVKTSGEMTVSMTGVLMGPSIGL